ncbi:MAG: ribulose-phosphate 3-epimerase [candidate division Zixibacteria bacterium]|nr:ribulose-phosphate 3-epimerase [candidate division Zixibacteria bacterium]
MTKIAPSILAADFARLGEEIKAAETAGADMIHLDIMDGHFVPNLSLGEAIAAMSKAVSTLPHDAHLMVTDPEYYIGSFAKIGVEYITFHLEIEGIRQDLGPGRWVYVTDKVVNVERVRKIISAVRKAGCKPGLSLNPPTKIELVFPFLSEIDLLLLMSVNPGFAGQKFIDNVYDKISAAAGFRKEKGLNFEIMVDGGIGLDNAARLAAAGADILVTGSSFFKAPDYGEFIRKMKT